jgi:DNA polymerase III delta prime subunit
MTDDDNNPNGIMSAPADVIAHLPAADRPRSLKALADRTRRDDARRRHGGRHSDDDGWMRSRTPSDAIADEALAAALPRDVLRRLLRGDPVALVVGVPGPDWVGPIADAIRTMSRDISVFARDGTNRREHVPTHDNGAIATALRNGSPVVGVSPSPAAQLPATLVAAADASVSVAPPDADAMRRVLARCGHRPVPKAIPPAPCAGLSFDDITAAFRNGASGRDVLAALDRMRSRKATPVDDTVPTLDKLPGFSGEARRWPEKLASDWRRWKDDEIPFSALDSALVIAGPPGCGKTLFARSLARTLGVPCHEDSVGRWFTGLSDGALGGTAQAFMRSWDAAMADARLTGAVYVLDELDGLPSRSRLRERESAWWSALISLVLQTLTTDRTGLVLLGLTNAGSPAAPKAVIDGALLRPGRMNRLVYCGDPSPEDISQVLSHHVGFALSAADLLPVARMTAGASAAQAAAWARDAMNAARDAGRAVTVEDIVAVATPPDRRPAHIVRRIALHEAAHAVIAHAFGHPVDAATIVVTATTDGETRSAPTNVAFTADVVDEVVVVGLAGRAAEEAFLGAPSAGAEGDLAQATALLAAAHGSLGLGAWLLHRSRSIDASTLLKDDSDMRAVVEAHLGDLYRRALALVTQHRAAIERVADALIARRLLTGDDIRVLAGDVAAGGRP